MTINDMHLSVIQGVDKIHAQIADTLLATEIDRELNKAIEQFVNTRFQKNNKYGLGFEESQKRRDDLRTLVVEDSKPAVFKEIVRNETQDGGALIVDTITLPYNYRHLINISSVVMRSKDCSPFSYILRDQDKLFYFVLNYKNFITNGGGNYLRGIQLVDTIEEDDGSGTQQSIYDVSGLGFNDVLPGDLEGTDYFNGLSYPQDKQLFIDTFIEWINSEFEGAMVAFWESWWPSGGPENAEFEGFQNAESFSFPGSFVILVNETGFPDYSNFDANGGLPLTNMVGYDSNNDRVVYEPVRYAADLTVQRRIPSTTDFIRETHPCRLIQHDDIFKLLDDPFNKTKYTSPLTVMRGTSVDIYTDDTFVIDRIRLTYLRQPVLVSLSTNTDCDLPVHTHEEVCKLAVSSILEEISDPRYQGHLTQVDKME
jgi:hypothetical protein|tara:strand:- start:10245 stop:11522 length:1278 start_codon:yes stop_codon:yes gene_type:complete